MVTEYGGRRGPAPTPEFILKLSDPLKTWSRDIAWERHDLDGAVAVVGSQELVDSLDPSKLIAWSVVAATAVIGDTAVYMSIGNESPLEADWHASVWRSLRHRPDDKIRRRPSTRSPRGDANWRGRKVLGPR